VPAFDAAFFGGGPVRALQNIGGIANVTVVGRGMRPIAFDTGPGNTLLDAAARRLSRGRLAMDRDGRLAARGRVDQAALARLLAHPFLRRRPPKSTGPETFDLAVVDAAFGRGWTRRAADVLATLTRFTAHTIVDAHRRWSPAPIAEVVVSGGGALNPTLMAHLRELSRAPVRSIAELGLPPLAKEPVAFAYLGLCTLEGRVNHLPHTTGAAAACVLGSLTPGRRRPSSHRVARRRLVAGAPA
jgi:anhydro-N-acetylmuramic acid kinase